MSKRLTLDAFTAGGNDEGISCALLVRCYTLSAQKTSALSVLWDRDSKKEQFERGGN